uniref:Putative structural protein n=1 Tax=viral metagenome TaxID=1070528 RepID=A0A6M3KV67_9ZZZZ
MPGVKVGVYPISLDAGSEVSSTYEGRHITVREDELIHPYIADGFVNKGDPVILCSAAVPNSYGSAVGVAFNSGAAAADLIAVDTEGIWNLTVYAEDDSGNAAIVAGDRLYIRAGALSGAATGDGTGDAEISKITNTAFQVPFGYALATMAAGNSGVIAVKVHFDPTENSEKRMFTTVTSGAYTYGKHYTSVFAGGQSTGLEYHDQQVTGTQTGPLYGMGTWMELAAGFIAMDSPLVCFEVGLYDAGATLTLGRVIGIQMQIQVASQPATFYLFRVNGTNGFPIDAMFVVGNPNSLGWVAGAETATYSGSIPFYSWGGTIGWIRLYDGSS